MFLDMLWPEIPESAGLLVWTLPDKRSAWCQSGEAAEALAVSSSEEGRNAYFGVGLADLSAVRARAEGQGRSIESVRAESSEVCGLYGLAADLDVLSSGHKKRALFPTVEAAQRFLDELPRQPTAVVSTGGGLQAHWIFREAWLFENEEERRLAEAISRGWNSFLRGLAKRQGYEIDATWDLARVLRIPGTTNHKYPAPVELASFCELRYNPSDFEAWRQESGGAGYEVGELVLDAKASPPMDKLLSLEQIEPRVTATLHHNRKDLADSSPSAYDQSLANFAVSAGWSDQEITDLIILHRRMNGADLKLRQDYYRRTIAKARGESAAAELEDDGLHVSSAEAGTRRGELLSIVRAKTGIPVQRILRYGQESPQYCLVLDDGDTVLLGGVRDFTLRPRWEEAAVLAGCTSFTRPSNKDWSTVKAAAIAAVEMVETPEISPIEVMRTWVSWLLPGSYRVNGSKGRFQAIEEGMPFTLEGRLYFRFESLFEHLKQRRERIDRVDLRRRLSELGWSSQSVTARRGDSVVHRRYLSVGLADLQDPHLAEATDEEESE